MAPQAVTGEHQGHPDPPAGLGQGSDVLSGLDIAHVEHEPLGQPVAGPDPVHLFVAGRHHLRARGRVDHHRRPAHQGPDPLGGEGETATTTSARRRAWRTSTRSPATRIRGKAQGVSKMAMSCTVETVGRGPPEGQVDVESVEQVGRSEAERPGQGPGHPARLARHQRRRRPAGSSARPPGRTAATRSASISSSRAARSSRM